MNTKSKVSYVAVNRAEGPTRSCGAVLFYTGGKIPANYDDSRGHYRGANVVKVESGKLAGAVEAQFRVWGVTAPTQEEGGYDKCDFKVVWQKGESYEGRFDMQDGGTDGGQMFWESLRDRIEFYACVRRPAHFNNADWAGHCQRVGYGDMKSAEKMLNECEIGYLFGFLAG